MVFFIGVLAQLILAVLLYVAPTIRGHDRTKRDALIARTEQLPRTRTATLTLGVVLALVADLTPGLPTVLVQPLMRAGWLVVILAVVAHLAIILWPLSRTDPDRVPSGAAAPCDGLMIYLSVDVARDPAFQHPGSLLAGDLHRLRP